MAEIAVALQHALTRRNEEGTPGHAAANIIARGDGWTVADVVCTSGPGDRSFEEQHTRYSVAIVVAGSFQYRSALGSGVMTPGSLMLGNSGQCYECGHEHGEGDRCVSFWFEPDYFERVAADAGLRRANFNVARLPALRSFASMVASAAAGVMNPGGIEWEELGLGLAARAATAAAGASPQHARIPLNAEARVTRTIRMIDRTPAAPFTVAHMAKAAGLSPYHFLRTFQIVTGVTPHQYVMRARLRAAAVRLAGSSGKVLDVALECGFGDVSNFNRACRTEFGVSPSQLQRRLR